MRRQRSRGGRTVPQNFQVLNGLLPSTAPNIQQNCKSCNTRNSVERQAHLQLHVRHFRRHLTPTKNPVLESGNPGIGQIWIIGSGDSTRRLTNPAARFSRLGCADDKLFAFPPTLDGGPRRRLQRGPPNPPPLCRLPYNYNYTSKGACRACQPYVSSTSTTSSYNKPYKLPPKFTAMERTPPER